MKVPSFLIWHCAGCGAAAEGTKKPCECATNVGIRRGPNGPTETTWWDGSPETVSHGALLEINRKYHESYGYLSRLLASVAPGTEPLDTLPGLCTQIDNVIAGLRGEIKTAALMERVRLADMIEDEAERREGGVIRATMALTALSVRRGRYLTNAEQWVNLQRALSEEESAVMRCKGASVNPEDGSCLYCDAISGEACRATEDAP